MEPTRFAAVCLAPGKIYAPDEGDFWTCECGREYPASLFMTRRNTFVCPECYETEPENESPIHPPRNTV